MTHPNTASGYTCSCDTSTSTTTANSQPSQYVLCLQAWDILALCLFAIAVWLFNMECQQQPQPQHSTRQQQQQSTTESVVDNSPTAVTANPVTKISNDIQGDESSVTVSLSNNNNRGKSQLQPRRVRGSRSRKLIKANLKLTLSDPEDTDSEENLRSLDYSTNFMSINYPNTEWDNNNLPFDDVLNEQNESEGESKSKKIINRRLTVPANSFNNSANGSQESQSYSSDNLPSNSTISITSNDDDINNNDKEEVMNTTYCNFGHESSNNSKNSIKLTLDEVRHIRYAMTSADLDSLGVTESLKFDLLQGKICFACMKRRFTLFGSWGKRCHLCRRVICSKCSSEMDVKDEHLNRVPVELLSPQLKNQFTTKFAQSGNIQGPWPPVSPVKRKHSPRVCVDCQYFYIRASLD